MTHDTESGHNAGQPGTATFQITPWMHRVGGWVHRHPRAWIRLGNLETRILADTIDNLRVDRPIYVAGLARAGTTIVLEQLAAHPLVASHRYADFPFLPVPYWWNRWLSLLPGAHEEARERAHRDGIRVTSKSPEAFEEMLWMAFFPQAHDPAHSSVLDGDADHPEFELFYHAHIRKLLAIRGRRRYLAKGNYNLARLGYLRKLYADARFVILVRDPVWHIASLMKQQALFEAGESREPRALEHMRRVGHYEFGLDRRAINLGDTALTARIEALWRQGEEVEGWARYWAALHDYLADRLERDAGLRETALVVRYEDLCQQPRETLRSVFDHAELDIDAAWLEQAAAGLHAPTYYRPRFDDHQLTLISHLTAPAARRFGYRVSVPGNGG